MLNRDWDTLLRTSLLCSLVLIEVECSSSVPRFASVSVVFDWPSPVLYRLILTRSSLLTPFHHRLFGWILDC